MPVSNKLKVLLIGQCIEIITTLPSLFTRAGFIVDIISNKKVLQKSNLITKYKFVENIATIPDVLSETNLSCYDIIVLCDDIVLVAVLHATCLTFQQKQRLLPVTHERHFQHISSKIWLSHVLAEAGIQTPSFAVATNILQALEKSEYIGYPVMVKIDSSCGGIGVFECKNPADFQKLNPSVFNLPVLIQKKIIGTELDLSAFYQKSNLIYFSHSKIEKVAYNNFGPSVLRTYTQLGALDKALLSEMEALGSAIGANGFVNISCIQTAKGDRYFIEADMRPNAWTEFSKFLGDDPAIRISKWFEQKESMRALPKINEEYPIKLLLPYFLRMPLHDILLNRYQVWKYLPIEDTSLLFALLYRKFKLLKSLTKIINFFLKRI